MLCMQARICPYIEQKYIIIIMNLLTLSKIIFNKYESIQLTAGDRGIIISIRTEIANTGPEGALQNHQVVTGSAVHIIQYDGVGV